MEQNLLHYLQITEQVCDTILHMKQFHNFFLLGALSTLVDFLIYSLLILLDIHYVLAIILGYSAGLWINYEIGRRHIFTSGSKLSSTHKEFFAVVLIALVGVLLNIAIVHLLSFSVWEMDALLSRIIAIGVVFFWNFFARKIFVYH